MAALSDAPAYRQAGRGFTLVEMMVAVAVVAILTAIALPSLGHLGQRQRLAAATEAYVAELRRAREDAVHRGVPLFVTARTGQPWCWAVSTAATCDCTRPDPKCVLRGTSGAEFDDVTLAEDTAVMFEPRHGRATVSGRNPDAGTGATFAAPHGLATMVAVHPAGRPRACASGGDVGGLERCR